CGLARPTANAKPPSVSSDSRTWDNISCQESWRELASQAHYAPSSAPADRSVFFTNQFWLCRLRATRRGISNSPVIASLLRRLLFADCDTEPFARHQHRELPRGALVGRAHCRVLEATAVFGAAILARCDGAG